MAIDQSKIRNFCIIAHIDHGKSTLADRIIQMTGTLTDREMQEQVLDNMDLERERGITIKSQAVRIVYKADDGEEYIFNLIDTPGHVDFNYEVSRSLAACEGAILVVDAAQGIEAQTLANVYLAIDHDLEVMPVINKIDLPSADPERVKAEIEDVIGIDAEDAPQISAKSGLNVEQVLKQIVEKIPSPEGDKNAPLQGLIFDSMYDAYKGVIIFTRIKEGTIKVGTKMKMMATGESAEVVEVGTFGAGRFNPCDELTAGMVGYVTASLKNVQGTRVGDTITDADDPRNPHLNPNPNATDVSASNCSAASFNCNFSNASLKSGYFAPSVGYSPQYTIGFTFLYPGSGSAHGSSAFRDYSGTFGERI